MLFVMQYARFTQTRGMPRFRHLLIASQSIRARSGGGAVEASRILGIILLVVCIVAIPIVWTKVPD